MPAPAIAAVIAAIPIIIALIPVLIQLLEILIELFKKYKVDEKLAMAISSLKEFFKRKLSVGRGPTFNGRELYNIISSSGKLLEYVIQIVHFLSPYIEEIKRNKNNSKNISEREEFISLNTLFIQVNEKLKKLNECKKSIGEAQINDIKNFLEVRHNLKDVASVNKKINDLLDSLLAECHSKQSSHDSFPSKDGFTPPTFLMIKNENEMSKREASTVSNYSLPHREASTVSNYSLPSSRENYVSLIDNVIDNNVATGSFEHNYKITKEYGDPPFYVKKDKNLKTKKLSNGKIITYLESDNSFKKKTSKKTNKAKKKKKSMTARKRPY